MDHADFMGSYLIICSNPLIGGEMVSRRRNGTLAAAAGAGLNPYGWGNGKARKRPREYRTVTVAIKNDPMRVEPQEDQALKK